ncbi:MAG: hypothetical protein IPK63_10830 [Candidatus Competibacteraceae bacterium]|nr:hypothetical protein [Candidatus Competibacteraceae bacterium]
MNCQFCPYRAPIVGREDWQGAPQPSHHHDHPEGHDHPNNRHHPHHPTPHG